MAVRSRVLALVLFAVSTSAMSFSGDEQRCEMNGTRASEDFGDAVSQLQKKDSIASPTPIKAHFGGETPPPLTACISYGLGAMAIPTQSGDCELVPAGMCKAGGMAGGGKVGIHLESCDEALDLYNSDPQGAIDKSQAEYDPCAGLSEGEFCQACEPRNAGCVETAEVKTCQSGQCKTRVPADCTSCVEQGRSWQIGECQRGWCPVSDVGCFTTIDGCTDWQKQEEASVLCSKQETCGSCIEANELCMWMTDVCFMGADYWGPEEHVVRDAQACLETACLGKKDKHTPFCERKCNGDIDKCHKRCAQQCGDTCTCNMQTPCLGKKDKHTPFCERKCNGDIDKCPKRCAKKCGDTCTCNMVKDGEAWVQ